MTGSHSIPPVVVIMGVSGCGKTTVGRLLAERLGTPFIDADDLHPDANVQKMAEGIPLDDYDRRPWLHAVRRAIEGARSTGAVVACSALKRSYRDILIHPGENALLVHLDGTEEVIRARMEQRSGHFMPPGLLASQFAELEPPIGAICLDIRMKANELVDRIAEELV